MSKFDNGSRRLLYELDKNSRQPFTTLAKKTRMSLDKVRYRVEKLYDLGVIHRFYTVVDRSKVGYAYHKVLFKLHNVNERKVQEILVFLVQHPSTVWVARLDGAYDLGVTVRVTHIIDLSSFVDDFMKQYGSSVKKRVFSANVKGEYLTRDYLVSRKPKVETSGEYTAAVTPEPLDETNMEILRAVSENSRATAVEISGRVNLTPDSVLKRIRALERNGVITRYTLVLNHELLNQHLYKLIIHVNHGSPRKTKAFLNYLRSKPNPVLIVTALGEWDYDLDVEVRSIKEYRDLMMDLTSEYTDIIRDYSSLMVTRIHKYNYFA